MPHMRLRYSEFLIFLRMYPRQVAFTRTSLVHKQAQAQSARTRKQNEEEKQRGAGVVKWGWHSTNIACTVA